MAWRQADPGPVKPTRALRLAQDLRHLRRRKITFGILIEHGGLALDLRGKCASLIICETRKRVANLLSFLGYRPPIHSRTPVNTGEHFGVTRKDVDNSIGAVGNVLGILAPGSKLLDAAVEGNGETVVLRAND